MTIVKCTRRNCSFNTSEICAKEVIVLDSSPMHGFYCEDENTDKLDKGGDNG